MHIEGLAQGHVLSDLLSQNYIIILYHVLLYMDLLRDFFQNWKVSGYFLFQMFGFGIYQ